MVVGIGWNAGLVRSRLLVDRRLGGAHARALARHDSLDAALRELEGGRYGDHLDPAARLAAIQWSVAAVPLWDLRVLAGWLPPAGGELVRTLAGWWEVLNVESLLATLAGAPSLPPYDLGRLSTAWPRVRSATTAAQVRGALASSTWLDPGSDDPAAIVTWLRLAWAHRVARDVAPASRLAAGFAALVVARDLLLGAAITGAQHGAPLQLLGSDWRRARDLADLEQRLPRDAAWVLAGIVELSDLWRAEVRWWRTLEDDGHVRLRQASSGPDAVVGAFSLLLADAHRVQAALELATWPDLDEEVIGETL